MDIQPHRSSPPLALFHTIRVPGFLLVCCFVAFLFFAAGCGTSDVVKEPEESVPLVYRPLLMSPVNWGDLPEAEFVYPTGKPFISAGRREYESSSMILDVPRINYRGPVLDAVDDYSLTLGIGLYDYSPLPGPLWHNANISIAGHRDVYGNEFYYVDTITDGDELYLFYDGKKYTYVYDSTKIIEDDDWSVIFCTGYPTLTLTSCHPIGTSDQRIVVRAQLTDISDI